MSGLNKYVKPIIKNFNELTSFPIYREVGNFFSRFPRSWELLFQFTEKLETSFLVYREVGKIVRNLPSG